MFARLNPVLEEGARAQGDHVAERRAQQQNATRRGIMLAAARAVAEHGYGAATMRVIAKEAGFTASSLYTYFRSKEQLFEELRAEIEEEFTRAAEREIPLGQPFAVRVSLLSHRLLHLTEQFSDALVLYLSEVMPFPDRIKDRCAVGARHLDTLSRWFQAHSSEEERSGHTAEISAVLFFGITHGILKNTLILQHGRLDPALLTPCAAMITRFFLAALSAEPCAEVEAYATEKPPPA